VPFRPEERRCEHTRVSKATAALVVVDQLHAVEAAGGVAGPGQAFVEIPLAVFPDESRRAGARVAAHAVRTLPSVQTAGFEGAELGGAVVLVQLALEPCGAASGRASLTASNKAQHLPCGYQPLCGEYVICRLTMRSRRAGAREAVDEVDTGSAMEAGPRVAFVDIILAVHPLVARFTLEQETQVSSLGVLWELRVQR